MTLTEWNEFLSIIEHVATVAAIFVGGVWALTRFRLSREAEWKLDIDVSPAFHKLAQDRNLLCASLKLRNIGNVKISPKDDGCWFSLRQVPSGVPLGATPHWGDCDPVVDGLPVITHGNPNHFTVPLGRGDYLIEPGAEFVETINVVVKPGVVLMAEVGFLVDNDEQSVWTYRVWQSPA